LPLSYRDCRHAAPLASSARSRRAAPALLPAPCTAAPDALVPPADRT